MSQFLRGPMLAVFLGLLGVIFVILLMPFLAGTPMVDSTTSLNLTSAVTEMSALMTWFAGILLAGVIYKLFEK